MREPDAVLNLLFHLITGFANPVYELGDIETEDLETVDSTVDGEDLPKAHKYGQHSVGDVHLWGFKGKKTVKYRNRFSDSLLSRNKYCKFLCLCTQEVNSAI